jgi:hypothetical protein
VAGHTNELERHGEPLVDFFIGPEVSRQARFMKMMMSRKESLIAAKRSQDFKHVAPRHPKRHLSRFTSQKFCAPCARMANRSCQRGCARRCCRVARSPS